MENRPGGPCGDGFAAAWLPEAADAGGMAAAGQGYPHAAAVREHVRVEHDEYVLPVAGRGGSGPGEMGELGGARPEGCRRPVQGCRREGHRPLDDAHG